MDFPEHLHRRLRAGLLDASAPAPSDVYALSLYWSYEDDEPSRPRLELSWNTEQRVRWVLEHENPFDEGEARWNYAYWAAAVTGEYLAVVGDSRQDPVGAALRPTWFDDLGLSPEPEYDTDEYEAWQPAVQNAFLELCVAAGRRLHDDDVVLAALGRTVPVIVHELEYDDSDVQRTIAANPPGAADGFAAWVAAE